MARDHKMIGNRNARNKLTTDDVRLVRALHAERIEALARTLSIAQIAEKFEVGPRAIERAVCYQTHRGVL